MLSVIGILGHCLEPYRDRLLLLVCAELTALGQGRGCFQVPITPEFLFAMMDGSVPKNTEIFKLVVFPGVPGWLSHLTSSDFILGI